MHSARMAPGTGGGRTSPGLGRCWSVGRRAMERGALMRTARWIPTPWWSWLRRVLAKRSLEHGSIGMQSLGHLGTFSL